MLIPVVYDGPFEAVEVPEAGIVAERGKPVDVDEEIAARLLEQDTWREAKPKTPQKTGKAVS